MSDIEFGGASDKGCVRTNNEDSFGWAPELGLYVLADGMGGANAGERASQMAVQTVINAMRTARQFDMPTLVEALESANRQVLAAAKSDTTLEGMGTTLVAALATEEDVQIASVGDSRAYLIAGDRLSPVTEDQSWVHEVGRVMGLDEATLKAHPLRHVLTMAIGAGQRLIVNRYTVPWQVGDTLLMCSDGLHGVVPVEDIERIVREGLQERIPLQETCSRLITAAKDNGGPDNITTILLRRTL